MKSPKKLLRLMFLVLFSLGAVGMNAQTISKTFKNATFKNVIKEIEQQTGLSIIYKTDEVNESKKITANYQNTSVGDILMSILDSDLEYKLQNRIIVISKKKLQKSVGNEPKKRITGQVVDEKKEAVIGANILLKGTVNGTISDVSGKFSLDDVPESGLLTISYLGYQNEEIAVKNKKQFSIVLKENSKLLDEVIVTALGMKREEKSLGYAVSKVTSEDLNKAAAGNWLNSLSGKAPGMALNKASSGPMGSVRVTLRGESSLDLSNNGALFVVDGVPINNEMTASGGSSQNTGSGDMPVDFGNGSSDLNPEDIESVSVLKGPAATALYGSRAANGAIVITTKSGEKGKGIGVSYSFGVTFDQINKWPDLQYEYGSGGVGNHEYYQYNSYDGIKSTHSSQAWGPKFDPSTNYYQLYNVEAGINVDGNGNRIATPWIPYDGYIKDFFKTGVTYKNTVTVEGGNSKDGRFRISYTNTSNDYIVPNTGFKSHTFSVSADKKLNKYISTGVKVNYYKKSSDNLPAVGYGASSVMYSLLTSSPNIDINWLKNYWTTPSKEQWNSFNTSADNPYFIANEQLNAMNRDRVFGNANLKIKLHKKVELMLRTGLDMYNESRDFRLPLSSKKNTNGQYREQDIFSYELNNDFLLTYKDAFGSNKKWGLNLSFGGNNMSKKYTNKQEIAERLVVPGVYNLSNSKDRLLSKYAGNRKIVNSFFGLAQFNYDNYAYLDVTGRNDWSSTLPKGNNSYFYPSVAVSILFNEIFGLRNDPILSLAKLRMSYAKVGNDTNPYRLDTYYSATDWGGAYMVPTTANNKNLKPEMVTSYEIGTDIRFFRNRLGIDITYYMSDSRNLIMAAPVDPSSGVQNVIQNAGHIRNSGIEMTLNGTIVKSKDFTLRATATWSKNNSKVYQLAPGIDTWRITEGTRGAVEARVGGSTSAMWGYGFKRVPENTFIQDANNNQVDISGKIIYDSNGYPIVDKENYKYIDEITPNWRGSFGFSAKYKWVSFNILFDGQMGGKVYSVSWQKMNDFGKASNTLAGRYGGLIGDGVQMTKKEDGTVGYHINDVVTKQIGNYYKAYYDIDNVESNMVNTTYLKLRELSVEFDFPKNWIKKTKVIQDISLSVFGRDLFVWSKFPVYDPEVSSLNGGDITPGYETAQLPSTRSMGASLRVKF